MRHCVEKKGAREYGVHSRRKSGMSTLPLNIDMRGKTAVIVGGGKVALRKLQAMSVAGVASRLVAPEVCPEIAELAAAGSISVRIGRYGAEDLDHAFLVVAATDDAAVNLSVATDAMERRLLVSVVDNPLAGNFTFPAVLRRGALEIAVSTGGRCPTLATDVRNLIADVIGEDELHRVEVRGTAPPGIVAHKRGTGGTVVLVEPECPCACLDLVDRRICSP